MVMARFKMGDRVLINVTSGSIYDKAGKIIGLGQMQNFNPKECYFTFNYKVELDDG